MFEFEAEAEGQVGNQGTTDSNGSCPCGTEKDWIQVGEEHICQSCGSVIGKDVPQDLYGDQSLLDDNFDTVNTNGDDLVTSHVHKWADTGDNTVTCPECGASVDTGDQGEDKKDNSSGMLSVPGLGNLVKDIGVLPEEAVEVAPLALAASKLTSQVQDAQEVAMYGRRVTDDDNNRVLGELPEEHLWI